MAVVGLMLLLFFCGIATAASVITPYNPENDIVAGAFASPQWLTYFPDYRLSQNIGFFDDPQFTREASIQQWTLSSQSQGITLSYSPEVSALNSPGGSLRIAYSGPPAPGTNSRATVLKTLDYPYNAPPSAFTGSVQVRVQGATLNEPIRVTMFAGKVMGEKFTLAKFNLTADSAETRWEGPTIPINSNLPEFNQKVIGLRGSLLSPATIIFPTAGTYRVSFDVEFTDTGVSPTKSAVVYLDDVKLNLLGNAFGLLGTDGGGRDLFTQLVYGARVSLTVGLVASILGIAIGLIVGLISGYIGKLVDEVLMRFTDMMLVIPTLPLLLVLIAVLGPSLINLIIVLGVLGWTAFARIVRSQVLTLKERPFIEASRAAGAGTFYVVRRHIIPNVVSLTYVNLALAVPNAILSEAALSWLGLYDPTVTSWGRILYNAQVQGGIFQWWWTVPPGLAIAAVSLSFVLIGYALDDIFNPKLRRRR